MKQGKALFNKAFKVAFYFIMRANICFYRLIDDFTIIFFLSKQFITVVSVSPKLLQNRL